MNTAELLTEGLSRLGIGFDQGHLQKLNRYLDEIELWNSDPGRGKKGLSLVRGRGETLVVRHLLDSLAGLPVIRRYPHEKIADIGSGAGFPGIPLAVFLPASEITLVERSGRKAAFLRNASACIGLGNVRVEARPLEEVTGSFDVVTFRALKRIGTVLDDLVKITGPNGVIAAYKGRRSEVADETGELSLYAPEVYSLEVPFLGEERNLVVIRVSSDS